MTAATALQFINWTLNMLRNKFTQAVLLWLAGITSVYAAEAQVDPQKQIAPIDSVVAVVNDDVVTRRELDERISGVLKQLQKQGIALPPRDALERQVLDRMIIDLLQAQLARETGVHVEDSQLDKTLLRIAQENNFPSLDEFRVKLAEDGVNYKKFREEIRAEIVATRLREREVDSKVFISEGEVDNYLARQAKLKGRNDEYQLAHILILVPEQANADKIQASRDRAEQAQARLQAGADFAQVAAEFSDAKDAMQGGNLGMRPADRLPALFLDELQKMQPGGVSPILRSPNGFHIIKLINKRSGDAPLVITQTHVRHILIKTSKSVPENEARSRLLEIRQRIETGADFAEQAKRYSEDCSASQGGDLGWVSPCNTVPEF